MSIEEGDDLEVDPRLEALEVEKDSGFRVVLIGLGILVLLSFGTLAFGVLAAIRAGEVSTSNNRILEALCGPTLKGGCDHRIESAEAHAQQVDYIACTVVVLRERPDLRGDALRAELEICATEVGPYNGFHPEAPPLADAPSPTPEPAEESPPGDPPPAAAPSPEPPAPTTVAAPPTTERSPDESPSPSPLICAPDPVNLCVPAQGLAVGSVTIVALAAFAVIWTRRRNGR